MPYIPSKNRPGIDEKVEALAGELAAALTERNLTAEISQLYRDAFVEVGEFLYALETGSATAAEAATPAKRLAAGIFEATKGYQTKGGWLGELNYAVTRLIQAVPLKMFATGKWEESLRYWLYAETVGALVRTANDFHAKTGNHWVGNGLAGVFEDVKDEYKRRVNSAYEAVQILKSGDCYDMAPVHTQLVPFETAGVKGHIEIMLPWHRPEKLGKKEP